MEYVILVIALAAVVVGADFLVDGAISIAKRYRVSDFVIGAAIVGIGTSMPELVVSTIGAIGGNSDVAIGNVVGSNIFYVLAIVGLSALIFPVAIDSTNAKFVIPLCIFISLLLLLLTFNFFNGTEPRLSRVDGLAFLGIFACYMYYSFSRDRKNNSVTQVNINSSQSENEKVTPLGLAILKVIGGLTVLITGSHFFVEEAVVIATAWGVDEAFISITLIACGTSLPELAASVAAAAKKNTQLALGNIVGSNIFNITLILGLSSQITPLSTSGITLTDYIVMICAAICPAVFSINKKIGRLGGALMFAGFIAYTIYLTNNQI